MVWLRIRKWVVRPFFWSLVVIAFVLLCLRAFLSSDFARERIAARIEQQLSQILHRVVRIGELDFELLPFALRIENLAISGPRPEDPQLLTIRRLRVDADLDALRNDLIDLQSVSAQGVRLHLELYPDGSDNLPKFPSKGGGGRFELRIGGLFVDDGEFELDDQRIPLALSARALQLRLSGLGGTELQGNVTAQEVVTTLPKALPWPSTLTAKVRLLDDRVELLTARLWAPDLEARVDGFVGWRGGTNGEIRGVVETEGRLLDELGYLKGEIAGPLRFEGGVRFQPQAIGLEGRLTSPGVDILGFRLEDLAGEVTSGGPRISSLALALERAAFAGGPVSGSFNVDFTQPGPLARLAIAADGPQLQPVLAALDLPAPALQASAHGDVRYEFRLDDARRGVGDATLELRALPPQRAGDLPVSGTAVLGLLEGRLTFEEVELASATQRISLGGEYDLVGKQGRIEVDVASEDLGELARAQPFVATTPWPLWLPDAGSGELSVQVALAGGRPQVELAFDLAPVHAPGGSAENAQGRLVLDTELVREMAVELTRGDASLRLEGVLPLSADGSAGGVPLAMAIAFRNWPVAEAMPWLPTALPLGGPATGTLRLGGTIDDMTGEMRAVISPVTVAGLEFDNLDATLSWDAERLRLQKIELSAPSGRLSGSGELLFASEALRFDLATEGLDLATAPWGTLTGGKLVGSAALTAQLTGTLTAPRLILDGSFAGIELPEAGELPGGFPEARAREAPTRLAGTIHAELADRHLAMDLDLPGLLTLTGGGPFVAGESGELSFQLRSDRLDRWLTVAVGQPVDHLSGAFAAELEVDFGPATPLAWTVRIPELVLQVDQHRLRPIEPVVARFADSRLAIESFYLGEAASGDELFVSGSVQLGGSGDLEPASPALDLRLQAEASVDWLEPFTGVELTGGVRILATIKGSVERPEWNGQAELHDGRYIAGSFPHSFDGIQALLLLYPGVVVLDHARSELAGGTVSASGRLDLATAEKPLAYRLQVAARRNSLRYPEGWLVRGDGDFTLQSTADGRQIAGSLILDRVFYLQDINLSPRQLAERVLSRTRMQVDETDEFLGTTFLNISILAPDAVRVRNNLAKIDGSASLALRGSLANPVLFGEVTADPGGTIEYNGSTYELDRAIVTFANPSRIEPLLDVVARTKINEYQVTLSVLGSLARPGTTLGSDPPLPDYDVLSLLATGSPSGLADFGSAQSAAQPGLAAETLLYGQAASLVSARVGKLFGVDRLKVDPLAGGDSLSAARVTVGKRLSSRVYLTYSVDPSSTAQQVLQVEWKVSDDLTLVLTQNGDESYAVDARWEKRF